MLRPAVDDSHWPILRFNVDGPPTESQAEAVLGSLDACLQRSKPFAIITDMSSMVLGGKNLQHLYVDFVNKHRDALGRLCKADALIVPAGPTRLLVNAFLLVARLPFPTRAVGTDREATAWCRERLSNSEAA